MSQSPDKPWVPGKHPTHTAFRMIVNICQDSDGNVWSDHNFATDEESALALGLENGGAPQVAHSLLIEAVRREVFLCALIEQSRDQGFLARWLSDPDKTIIEGRLQHAVETTITQTLKKMVPGAISEVLAMMADQGV